MSKIHTDFIKNSRIVERIIEGCSSIDELIQRIEYDFTIQQIADDIWQSSSALEKFGLGTAFTYEQATDLAIAVKYAIAGSETISDFEKNIFNIFDAKEL